MRIALTGGKDIEGKELDRHVLRAWSNTGNPPLLGKDNPDYGDYNTGIAVFWHYVLWAWHKNQGLKNWLNQNYKTFVTHNADTLLNNNENAWKAIYIDKIDENKVKLDSFVNIINEIAVLVLAAVMSEE